MIGTLSSLRELNLLSMMLRILLAMLMGGVIGFDRELKGRPAGFRTYMFVAVGAALTVILSQYLDLMLSTLWAEDLAAVGRRTDVVRLGARVISGIGFIGTGTIMVTARHEIKGLTTASCLWASACMGLAIGAGFYECVLLGFLLIVLSIRVLPLVESAVVATARNINVFVEMDTLEHLGDLINRMKESGLTLYDVEIEKSEKGNGFIEASFALRMNRKIPHVELLAMLSELDGIISIEEV